MRRHAASTISRTIPRRRPRQAAELVVCALVGVLLVGTWHVEWFVVSGGSMADSLRGSHWQVTCPDCGHSFACGSDEPPMPGKRAVCSNCGHAGQVLDELEVTQGEGVLVHKAAFAWRRPRRWEVIAFRGPAAGELYVKRVVGLPGETIEIRQGDVVADGVLQRKTLAQQRALAILVHDNRFQPQLTSQLPPRWRAMADTTGWRAEGARFIHAPTESAATGVESLAIDWLAYRHWQRAPGVPTVAILAAVSDAYGYNQTRPITESFPVHDLLLSCRVRTSGRGALVLRASDGRDTFQAQLDPETGHATLAHNAAPVAVAGNIPRLNGRDAALEMSLVDQQFLLALDGTPVFRYPYWRKSRTNMPRSDGASLEEDPNATGKSRPLALGLRGIGIEVWDLQVFRDVYYSPDGGIIGNELGVRGDQHSGGAQYRLGGDEYFVLGDNSPISEDSRHWRLEPMVSANMLIGRPLLVHFPLRPVAVGGLRFQVPELSRIRYIR